MIAAAFPAKRELLSTRQLAVAGLRPVLALAERLLPADGFDALLLLRLFWGGLATCRLVAAVRRLPCGSW